MGYLKSYQFDEQLYYEENRYGAFCFPEIQYVHERFRLICCRHDYYLMYDVRETDSRGTVMATDEVLKPQQIFLNKDYSHEHTFARVTEINDASLILG